MRLTSYVWRHLKTAVFWYRRAVPKDVRGRLPRIDGFDGSPNRVELTKSLRTKKQTEASGLAAAIDILVEAAILRARETEAPLPTFLNIAWMAPAQNHELRMKPDGIERGLTPPGPLPKEGNFVNVKVGAYIDDIETLSIEDLMFAANFYIWFTWSGPKELDPGSRMVIINQQEGSA